MIFPEPVKHGKVLAALAGPWARGSGPHAFGEREALSLQGFDVTDDLEAQKRPTFFWFWCRFFHDAEGSRRSPAPFQGQPELFVGWPPAASGERAHSRVNQKMTPRITFPLLFRLCSLLFRRRRPLSFGWRYRGLPDRVIFLFSWNDPHSNSDCLRGV